MQSKTLRHAEKKALDGANESQDTLVIAHYLMMDFGVGLVSVALTLLFRLPWLSRNLARLTLGHCAEEQLTTSRRTDASPFAQAEQATKSGIQQNWQVKQ